MNWLHPELLGMVFEHLRSPIEPMDPEELFGQPVFDPYKPLLSAMMVCHKWYIVAVEKASLWTDVDYSRGRTGPTCLLERSGTAPIRLRLIIDGPADNKAYLREIVRTNAFRLRELDVYITDIDTMNTVGQLLEDDMPLLQFLKMSTEYYQWNGVLKSSWGRFPSLRRMMLVGDLWLPTSEVGSLTRLTDLHISTLSNDLPLASITTLLRATPALEVLELHNCSELTLAELPTTTTLEHLTHLTIRAMSTRIAEVLMPALVLPRAIVVCLWYDVESDLSNALLPQPEYWRNATKVRIDADPYGSLYIELEGDARRIAICFTYDTEIEGEGQPLWPLPIPTTLNLANISTVHLSLWRGWKETLWQFVGRVPALSTLVLGGRAEDEATTRDMIDALRDLLLQGEPRCTGLREVALFLPCVVDGLTEALVPALKKRKDDGQQIKRLKTWIDNRHTDNMGDVGDGLAEYVEAGEVEHEFRSRDEELWRRENEFGLVQRMWW